MKNGRKQRTKRNKEKFEACKHKNKDKKKNTKIKKNEKKKVKI